MLVVFVVYEELTISYSESQREPPIDSTQHSSLT